MEKKRIAMALGFIASLMAIVVLATSFWLNHFDEVRAAQVIKEEEAKNTEVTAIEAGKENEKIIYNIPKIERVVSSNYKGKVRNAAKQKSSKKSEKVATGSSIKASKKKKKKTFSVSKSKTDVSSIFDDMIEADKAKKAKKEEAEKAMLDEMTAEQRERYLKKKAEEKERIDEESKRIAENDDTANPPTIVQTNGSRVTVADTTVKDEKGKKISVSDPKMTFDLESVINSVLKDKDGNWIDNSEDGADKRYAKKHGITVEEVKKMRKEGKFDNGDNYDGVKNYVGDGSPEDDAGMDFH